MGLSKVGRSIRQIAFEQCWLFPATLIVTSSVLLFAGDAGRDLLRFEREAIADLELWRVVTGHLVHLGLSHFLLNVAGLLLVWILAGREFPFRDWLVVGIASVAAIDIGLWLLSPALQWYVGLSGVLHGLLAAGVVAGLGARRPDAMVLGAVLLIKLAYEQFAGPLPGSEAAAGDRVVVDAHLYGAVGGALTAAVLIRVRRSAPI